jgi:hypothetical protein
MFSGFVDVWFFGSGWVLVPDACPLSVCVYVAKSF